ncbi:MAG: hypothetical protein GF320_03180, partial [Armatimonadia bacterium]|nr:hypothetical protein [Armatimonadia bacterium]
DGTARGELPEGTYQIGWFFDQPLESHHCLRQRELEVAAGQEHRFVMEFRPTVSVSGRVLAPDAERVGLADVSFTSREPLYSQRVDVDRDGHFELRILPGDYQVRTNRQVFGRMSPRGDEEAQAITVPPEGLRDLRLELPPQEETVAPGHHAVEVTVLDSAGAPVEGAKVFVEDEPRPGHTAPRVRMAAPWERKTTGPDGRLRIYLDETMTHWVSARTDTLATPEPTQVEVDGEESLTLTVEAGVLCTARVRLVGGAGQATPVPEPRLVVSRGIDNKLPFEWIEAEPQGDGVFRFSGLWPRVTYSVLLGGDRYVETTSGEWEAVPGASHDYGELVLRKRDAELVGRVVDPEGHGIAGATVAIDGGWHREPLETETAADGTFRLSRLSPQGEDVVVRADGYMVARVHGVPDGGPATIVLEPVPEPVFGDPIPPATQPLPSAMELTPRITAIAEGLATRLEEMPDPAAEGAIWSLLVSYAAYDLESARSLMPEELALGVNAEMMDRFLWSAWAASRLDASTSADQAEALLEDLQEAGGFHVDTIARVGVRAVEANPDLAAACAETLLDPPDDAGHPPVIDTVALAGAAHILLLLGDDRGEATVRAAVASLDGLGADERSFVAEPLAIPLALVDVEAALDLFENEEDSYFGDAQVVANSLARFDPQEAVRLCKRRGMRHGGLSLAECLGFFPPEDLDQAMELVASIEDPGSRCLSLARLVHVAPEGRKREVFLRAVEVALTEAPGQGHGDVDARLVAQLACLGRRLGYEGYLTLARLAAERVRASASSPDTAWEFYMGATEVAPILAFVDRDLARELLEEAMAQPPPELDAPQEVTGWYQLELAAAAAEVDIDWGLAMMEEWGLGDSSVDPRIAVFAVEELLQRFLWSDERREDELLAADYEAGVIPRLLPQRW